MAKFLKEALATSKCIVPLFCGMYFQSNYCSREFSVMYHRQKNCDSSNLILPVLIRDGDNLPKIASNLQNFSLKPYFTSCESFRFSPEYMSFEKQIRILAQKIANSIKNAPKWDSTWLDDEWINNIPLIKAEEKEIGNPTLS